MSVKSCRGKLFQSGGHVHDDGVDDDGDDLQGSCREAHWFVTLVFEFNVNALDNVNVNVIALDNVNVNVIALGLGLQETAHSNGTTAGRHRLTVRPLLQKTIAVE